MPRSTRILWVVLLILGGATFALPIAAQETPAPTSSTLFSVVLPADIYVRSGPAETYPTVGSLEQGDLLRPLNRSEDSLWVLIRYGRGVGWVRRDLGAWIEDIDALPVLPNDDLTITPGAPATPPLLELPTATPSGNWMRLESQAANLRAGPGTDYPIIGLIRPGTTVEPVARDTEAEWILVREGAGFAWISRPLVAWQADLQALPVLVPPNLTPSATFTPSRTPSRTPTLSATATARPSATASLTPTATYTPSETATETPSLAPTALRLMTNTPAAALATTPAPEATTTPRPTIEPTATVSPTIRASNISQPTATDTLTDTPSATASNTATTRPTNTAVPTETPTSTSTPTRTATRTVTALPTETATVPQPTKTDTETAVAPLVIPTASATPSATPTRTPSRTSTRPPVSPATATSSVTPASVNAGLALTATSLAETRSPIASLTPTSLPRSATALPATETPVPATVAASATTAPTQAATTRPTRAATTPAPTQLASPTVAVPESTPEATVAVTAGATAEATAVVVPGPGESVDVPPDGGTNGDTDTAVIVAVVAIAGLLVYGLLYWRGAVAADRYKNGFFIHTCPVCGRGDLNVETRINRFLGVPRPSHTIRCTSCRSLLREVRPGRWRYAVDPMENPELAERYNGKIMSDSALRALDISRRGRRPE